MAIPTILSGAAGRALRTLEPLRSSNGTLEALETVNHALPDMKSSLGDDAARALGERLFHASRGGTTRSATSREQVRTGLETLELAAKSEAQKRTLIGVAALAAIVGTVQLVRSAGEDDQPVPSAPGRPGDEPTHVSV